MRWWPVRTWPERSLCDVCGTRIFRTWFIRDGRWHHTDENWVENPHEAQPVLVAWKREDDDC